MQTQWMLFAGVLIFNSLVAGILAFMVFQRRTAPGSNIATLMFLALSVWALGYAMITLSAELPAKIFWLRFENVGILSVPNLWFLFTLRYTQEKNAYFRIAQLVTWIIPLVSFALISNNAWMPFYYSALETAEANGGPLVISRGPWYAVQVTWAYSLLALGFLLMLWHMFRLRNLYRQQLLLLLVGVAIPVIVNIIYQRGGGPRVDLTPISLTITAGFVSVGIFGLRMFELIPIARNVVMENIPELVLVVDIYNRVIDANQTALQWLNRPEREVIGQDLMQVFGLWPGLAGQFQSAIEFRDEIEIPGTPIRTLEMSISPIHNQQGQLAGRVFVARDMTGRKQIENELKQANKALKLQLAEIETLRIQLQEMAVRDSLTGLYNRGYLETRLGEELDKAREKNEPLCVAAISIDQFEQINKNYGHPFGDQVLLECAKLLGGKNQMNAIPCRYGGAKFIVILPGTSLEEARQRADQWRKALEALELTVNKKKVQTTLSAGIACSLACAENIHALLLAADQALYQANDEGYNRVRTQ